MAFIDLTGQRFGRWVVIEKIPRYLSERTRWKCTCDCGTTAEVLGQNLRNGSSKSCGCLCVLPEEKYLGKTFNRLTVINRAEDQNLCAMMNCVCTCGNYTKVAYSNLVSGSVKSCGCITYSEYQPRTVVSKPRPTVLGGTFGKLTVLEKIGLRGKNMYWLCVCECGNTTEANTSELKRNIRTSCGCNHHRIGKDNPNYTGNIDKRNNIDYYQWRLGVLLRDNYTCLCCGVRSNLHAHHLMPFTRFKEYRLLEINGVTLCRNCHIEFHSAYGIGGPTLLDFISWTKQKGFSL